MKGKGMPHATGLREAAQPNYTNTENLKMHLFADGTKIGSLLIYFKVNSAVLLTLQSHHPSSSKQLCFVIKSMFHYPKVEVLKKLANYMLV